MGFVIDPAPPKKNGRDGEAYARVRRPRKSKRRTAGYIRATAFVPTMLVSTLAPEDAAKVRHGAEFGDNDAIKIVLDALATFIAD
jgi:hypothetical protein